MHTLGVDLSADPRKTAVCLVEWEDGTARVHRPVLGLDDDSLLSRLLGEHEHGRPDWTGIDAPFGWPQLFVAAVSGWEEGRSWPPTPRPELRYRVTDILVTQQSRRPLSVSSDRIAVTAMRCAGLLTSLADRRRLGRALDRAGGDRVVEVYPGAALPLWSDEVGELHLDPQGYKAADDAKRRALVATLLQAAPWLRLDSDTRELCERNDDALDALLAALITRAAAIGETLRPETAAERAAAAAEGWIHLPRRDSLAGLAQAPA
jgi:Protein of unknown function (DUF429)